MMHGQKNIRDRLLGHILCYGCRKARTCTGDVGERKETVVGQCFWYCRCQEDTKETC